MIHGKKSSRIEACIASSFLWVQVIFFVFMMSSKAQAMLEQTSADLSILEDALQNAVTVDGSLLSDIVPMLVATPVHLYTESKTDFAPAVWSIFKKLIPTAGDLIQCSNCNMQRMHVGKQHTISIESGELSLEDLLDLARDKRYQGVKSVAFTKETPSGVEIRILRLSDGAILFQHLADGRLELNRARPILGLIKEYERRERGESLSYIFVDLGVYPTGLFHLSFLEQWGSLNQHISGVTLSLVNPEVALGASYRYMLPFNRKMTASAQLFFPLASVFQKDASAQSLSAAVGLQAAISSTYGVFMNVSSKGTLSIGFSLYNPILFPFML